MKKTIISYCLAILLPCLAIFGTSQSALGLEALIAIDPSESLAANLDEQKKRARRELLLQIDDLDRICKLTNKQKKKLEVAIKGVVEKRFPTKADAHRHDDHEHVHVVRARQRLPQAELQEVVEAPPEDHEHEDAGHKDAEEDGEEEQHEKEGRDEQNHQEGNVEGEGLLIRALAEDLLVEVEAAAADFIDVEDNHVNVGWTIAVRGNHDVQEIELDPLWQKTVAHILTPAQRKARKIEMKRRDDFEQQAIMTLGIAQVTKHLRMTLGQQEKLKRLCEILSKNQGNASNLSDLHSIVQTLDENQVRKILSKAQFDVWAGIKNQHHHHAEKWQVLHQLIDDVDLPGDLPAELPPLVEDDG